MTAAEASVAREILRIVQDDLAWAGELPSPDEPLAGRLDSLLLLSLVVAIEDRFHVVLTDDDAARARTLSDLACMVAARAAPERMPAQTVQR